MMEKKVACKSTDNGIDALDVIDAIPYYVMLVDDHHEIVMANRAVRDHFGLEPEELVGRYCPKAVHGVEGPFEDCPLEEAVRTVRAVEKEVFDEKSGHLVRSAVYPTKAVTPEGRKVFLHWLVDLTDREQAEEQLRAAHLRLRHLSENLERVREEEKKKIAHDLHDETSQLVASMNAYMEAAISKLPPGSDDVKTLLKKAQDYSAQIHDQLHKLIYELRPSILDDFGLVAAITWLTKNTLEVAGIQVDFKVFRQERNLSPELRIALYRIVQESINNILKHANAKNVTISLFFDKNSLRLGIKDDGAGFDVDNTVCSKDQPRGLGITGMKERVELFNGTFSIRSNRPGGTEINIEIPLKADTASRVGAK